MNAYSSPKTGGKIYFTGYSDNDGPKSTALVTGVIGDFGDAERTYSSGRTHKEYSQLLVTLTHGSFRLSIVAIERKLDAAIFGHFPTNTSTCSGVMTVAAKTPIVPASGTNAYKGISGTLSMTVTINEVAEAPNCPKTDTSPFLAQTVFFTGSGKVSL